MVRNLVLILLAGLNFSFLFPVNVLAFRAGIPATAYVFWYALGAGAIVLAIALAMAPVAAAGSDSLTCWVPMYDDSFYDSSLLLRLPYALVSCDL